MFKKFLPALVLMGFLALPLMGLAQTIIPESTIDSPAALVDLIETIGTWIFTALLAVAVIFIVVAGFYFVTAGGNPEQVNKARQMLINALIGLAVALAARGLMAIIENLLETNVT